MKKNVLSSKQTAILKFIKQFIESKPYPPSIRDIKNGCGLSSTSVVDYNLKILEEKKHQTLILPSIKLNLMMWNLKIEETLGQ